MLDAVAEREQVDVTDAELSEQVVRRAQRIGASPDDFAQRIVSSGQLPAFISEVRRGKALATVLDGATVTDVSGNPVDLESLRDDLRALDGEGATDAPDDVQVDEDGRSFHLHDDGSVHYLDQPA